MKKYILFVFGMIICAQVQAQSLWDISKPDKRFTFGLRVGHNASNVNGETEMAGTKSGLLAGVSLDYHIIKSVSLVTGIYYSSKGFRNNDSEYAKMHYLQVPLQGSYRIRTRTGVKFHFNVGPYFAYGLGGDMKLFPQSLSFLYKFEQDSFGDEGFFKRLDVGVAAGAHIELSHVLLGITYEYGFADIAKVYSHLHNRNVAVSLGYNF